MEDMPVFKLYYFNARAKAEIARQLLYYGDIEYEDVRIGQEEWSFIKPKMPFGKIPVLEVDGKMIPQSGAINRYLARRVGLYGKDEEEDADIDAMVETCNEMTSYKAAIFKENDPAQKAALIKQASEEIIPPYFDKLEMHVENDFLVGGRMTLADLYFVNVVLWPRDVGVTINLEKYPKLQALEKRVTSHPKIAAWIAERPVTPI